MERRLFAAFATLKFGSLAAENSFQIVFAFPEQHRYHRMLYVSIVYQTLSNPIKLAQSSSGQHMGSEQLLWQRVAETIEWCAMHLSTDNLKGSLRTLELGTPSSTLSWAPSWNVRRSTAEWNKLRADEDSRRSLVDTLADWRAKMLADAGRHPGSVNETMPTQQFIVYLPGTNLADGAAATVSDN